MALLRWSVMWYDAVAVARLVRQGPAPLQRCLSAPRLRVPLHHLPLHHLPDLDQQALAQVARCHHHCSLRRC